ncbi:autotransporter outer membrane beta-barrel domain-containing protein, partial [Phytopseudomonas argentinensis]
LQIGNGGNTGSVAGNILNNGILSFNRTDDITHQNAIAGSGQVVQAGLGHLKLGNGNSYSGGTRILSGSLIGSADSFGSGTIVNEATLIIDQQSDGALNNALSGQGMLRKTGNGKLVIEGNSHVGSGTLIEAGSLIIGGSAGSSANLVSEVTSAANTRLGGHGRIIGDVRMLAGSTLAAGNSIGTLTVNGNLKLDAGSTFEVEVDPSGTSDRLISTRTVDLGGATLRVLGSPGEWSPATTYSIISADRIDGTFGTVSSNLAFLTTDLDYSVANEVRLTLLRNDIRFDSVAQTYNQRATANAIESAGVGQRVYRAVSVLDPASSRSAFDSLSGELHANLLGALFDDSRHLREGLNARMLSAQHLLPGAGQLNAGDGVTFWLQGYGSGTHSAGDGNASSLTNDSSGKLLGVDLPVSETVRIGTAVGLANARVKDGRGASAELDTTSLAIYATAQWNAISLRTGAGRSWLDIDTRRKVTTTTLGEQPRGSYVATSTQVFAELGYRLPLGDYLVEPFLGLAHVQIEREEFRERGGDSVVQAQSVRKAINYSTMGVNATVPLATIAGTSLKLKGSMGWQHAFDGDTPESEHTFAGSHLFRVRGAPLERDNVVVKLGVEARVNSRVSLDLSYGGQFGEEFRDHGVRLGLTARF